MRPFGELEADIMKVMWAAPTPLSTNEIVAALGEERGLAYTTVMTVTDRLRVKGWLGREKEGRSYRYSPVRSSDDYTAELMRQALADAPDPANALLRFAGGLDPSEAEALRAALGDARTAER
ncbi:BlaI/MecI/CopY family transcriptional regulator [Streptomyces californicus]|uniref:BlaI/MecI/CopY family transcriptional regulator n=1 Tax=Streptomyces californicus TaxID=67351 RepID=UPI0036FA1248